MATRRRNPPLLSFSSDANIIDDIVAESARLLQEQASPDDPDVGVLTQKLLDDNFPEARRPDDPDKVSTGVIIFMRAVVICNVILIGVRCQIPECEVGPVDLYDSADFLFATIYTFEVVHKLGTLSTAEYFLEVNNVIDFVTTVAAVLELCIRFAFPDHTNTHEQLKALSLLRVGRLFRILRVLKNIPSLCITVGGLYGCIESLCWVVFVLILLIYVFAILFVLQVNDSEDEHFGDLFKAMTSLGAATVFVQWVEMVPPWRPLLLPVFYGFVLLSSFGVANLIIGVVVDATTETKHKLEWAEYREKLFELGKGWEKALAELRQEEPPSQTGDHRSVSTILKQIIQDNPKVFPPGMSPRDLMYLLDHDGDSRIHHEEFCLGIGQLMLCDNFQQRVLSFVNDGIARHMIRTNHNELKNSIKDLKECIGELKQSVAGTEAGGRASERRIARPLRRACGRVRGQPVPPAS